MSRWIQTRLFSSLKTRAPDTATVRALHHYLPLVETVLGSGVANSPDFTLHDADHGFRVAEMMADLLGEESIARLSEAEVAILLLSAYCHDVGMTPSRALSRAISQYVLTSESGLVTEEVAEDIQSWLDKNRPDVMLPVAASMLTSENIKVSEDVCAYYGRDRHNQWSEEWVRSEFGLDGAPSLYNGWVDDLVTVCKSHHEGLSELREDRFDAKIVGSPSQNMNLRYLAAILRLADVMEFDPERTPEVILRSRDIAPSSRIYWYKDREISFQLDEGRRQIIFTARTPNAQIHKAVLMTANWVNDELLTCSALAQENAYKKGTVLPSTRDNYDWVWPARLTTDIKEASASFVFIDGAFRPDPKRILELLSGTALYGRSFVAVRELVQNAIDAVREQIAYQRLASADPTSASVGAALAAIHSVKLRFYSEEGRYWLQCVDDGTGLSKKIIERSLLVGGSAPRPESRALERSAKAKGFEVGRTGKFGIGVLSYFMIADRLEIVTRRSQLAGDPDGTGWRFAVEGLSDFGELSKEQRITQGTDVRLRLKSEVLGNDPQEWLEELWIYLSSVLCWVPCQVSIHDEVFGLGGEFYGPGWTSSIGQKKGRLLSSVEGPSMREDQFYTAEWKQRFDAHTARVAEFRTRATQALRWNSPSEVELPDGLGIARLWLPHFEIDGEKSLTFLDLESGCIAKYEGQYELIFPHYRQIQAWRGFTVGDIPESEICCSEINYTNGMNISVDRNSFDQSENVRVVQKAIRSKALEIVQAFVQSGEGTKFHSLNQALLAKYGRHVRRLDKDIFWKTYSTETGSEWKELHFPVCSAIRNSFMQNIEDHPLRSEAHNFQFAETLQRKNSANGIALAGWIGGGRLLIEGNPNGYGSTACIAWASREDMVPIDGSILSMCADFPEGWDDVIAVYTAQRPIVNKNHPAVRRLSDKSLYKQVPTKREDLERKISACGNDSIKILEFVINAGSQGPNFWRILNEQFGEFHAMIIDEFAKLGCGRIVFWSAYGYGGSNVITELSKRGVRTTNGNRNAYEKPIINEVVDKGWLLEVVKRRDDRSGGSRPAE